MLWKCCTQYASKFGKLSSGHRIGKRSVFIPIPKKGNAKQCSNYHTMHSSQTLAKQCWKFSKLGFNSMWTMTFQMPKLDFRKGRGTRDQIVNICCILEKVRESQRSNYFCFIDYAKAFDCVDHNKLWKILRDGNTRSPDLPPEKSVSKWRSNS